MAQEVIAESVTGIVLQQTTAFLVEMKGLVLLEVIEAAALVGRRIHVWVVAPAIVQQINIKSIA